MDELIAFLRARLDEDERIAKAATPGPWRHNPDKHWRKPGTSWFEEAVFTGPAGSDATCVAGTGETDDPQSMADAAHIARHDPARVLADVAAKRAIVDAYEHALATKENIYKMWSGLAETPLDRKTGDMRAEQGRLHDSLALWDGKGMGLSLAVRHLALPYADHPDYREEWRP